VHLRDGTQTQRVLRSPAGAVLQDDAAAQERAQVFADSGDSRRYAQPQGVGIEYGDLAA
jgi:hypothetical protein